jgi:hypothetical protein
MSIALLELGAAALDDLLPEVVFVGGASFELWGSPIQLPHPCDRRRTSTLS